MSIINNSYLDKLQEQYEKKLAEFELNYQDTGSARTQNTIYKYSDMIKVICLARDHINQYCNSCERHRRDVKNLIECYKAYKKQGLKDLESFDKFISDLYGILI